MGGNSSNILESENESSHGNPVLARGEELYKQKGCIICHAINGTGGKTGPDLAHIGSKRDAQFLAKVLTSPRSVFPSSTMPAVNLSKKDLDALVKYLQSMK